MSYALESGITDPNGQSQIVLGNGPQLDASHRLRVSIPFTLFDQTFEWDLADLFWESVVVGGGSSAAFDADNSSVVLTAGTGATDSVIRQTRDYLHYRPGKSHLIPCTFTLGAEAANVRRRVGYFDANDGIFLEQNGTTDLAIVKRSSTSGTPVDTRFVQADWNLDPMDGTGSSGIDLDLSLGQLMVIDLQWLSEGRVRCGFDIGGRLVYFHQFLAANELTGPYMSSASLPIRHEITNLAAQGAAHTLRQGCSSVISEDGHQEPFGVFFSADNGTTSIAVTTRRAILSIRPKETFGGKVNRVPVEVQAFNLLVATNNARWEIVYNPTFSGTPVWVDPGSHSAIEYSVHGDVAAGAISDGIMLNSGYVAAGVGIAAGAIVQTPLLNRLRPTLDAAGANPRAFSLVITSMTGTSNVAGALAWKEVR